MSKPPNKWKVFWDNLFSALKTLLHDIFKKELLKKILGPATGGLKFIIVGFLLERLWRGVIQPKLERAKRRAEYALRRSKLKEEVKKPEEATSEADFNDRVDNLP